MVNEVNIHEMVTSSNTSEIGINAGSLKTFPGILRILQIILGCVVCGIIGHHIVWTQQADLMQPELLVLIVAASCLMTTTILAFSCLLSIATTSIMPKTLFESMYHILAAGLYICCFIFFIIFLTGNEPYVTYYDAKIAGAAVGIVNAFLYVLSSIFSVRAFRTG